MKAGRDDDRRDLTMPLVCDAGTYKYEPSHRENQRGRNDQRPGGATHVVQAPGKQHDGRVEEHQLDPLAVTPRHQEVIEPERREQSDQRADELVAGGAARGVHEQGVEIHRGVPQGFAACQDMPALRRRPRACRCKTPL